MSTCIRSGTILTAERSLDALLEQLHLYCADLYFEMGGFPDEEQELIITAEGQADLFGAVYEVIAEAPILKSWKFIALKQPVSVYIVVGH